MSSMLRVTADQLSDAGVKPSNEDSCGINIPAEAGALRHKGIAAVIADGVSASIAGREAAEACVQGFLLDYYSTPDSWSVKTAGARILGALNRWLNGQGQRVHGSNQGMVSTLSVLVIKSQTAHLFHVGDTRIWLWRGNELECLTRDHRSQVGQSGSEYLVRAMGVDLNIDIDYKQLPVETGDLFLLTTDGVHDCLGSAQIKRILGSRAVGDVPRELIGAARAAHSADNLTCQVLRVDELPNPGHNEFIQQLTALPFPPSLAPGMKLDDYRIVKELHASKRSELFLAIDEHSGERVALKVPSINYEDDPEYIDHFTHEEWVGRRIDNPYVMKIRAPREDRRFLYHAAEYLEGTTLRQWMRDHPRPAIGDVRAIVEQIVKGLRAFHRMEMVHRDLKPENLFVDRHGKVTIIDFGSTKIAGIGEQATPLAQNRLVGTLNYSAPEYLHGLPGSTRSDAFALGVIAYELLCGSLPYRVSKVKPWRARSYQQYHYISIRQHRDDIPAWIDGALKKAVHPDPDKRYPALSEFLHDFSHPSPEFTDVAHRPLIERNPLAFWRGLAALLAALHVVAWLYWSS